MEEMKNFTNLINDGGVKKIVTKEGSGDFPNDGDEIELHYEGKLASDGTVFDSSRGKASFKFILGKGKVIKGWEIAIRTMKKGEIAMVLIEPEYAYGDQGLSIIPSKATLIFEIELLNFYPKPKSKFEMDFPERLENAKQIKDEGITLFQSKNFIDAAMKFEDAYSYVDKVSPKEMTSEGTDLQMSLLLNMSNCYNQLKKWELTVKKIEGALKLKEHPKCYYYRGTAYANLEEFSKAEEDFNRLIKFVSGEDPGVAHLKKLIEDKKKEKSVKEKSMFKSFFKAPLYEDKEKIEENPPQVKEEPEVNNSQNP